MGQLSIGHLADLSWILPKYQPREYRSNVQRLAENAQYAKHVAIFTHVRCGALPLQSPAPSIGDIHSSLARRCDQCDSSVLPSPSSSCSSKPSMSSQSWCSLAAIAAFVECTTTDNALPRTAPFLTMLRLAMCGQLNPTAWAIKCAAMRVAMRP
ncbi:regulator of sigma E protease [Trypanosoma cruzi]|nr:regulator of sigma E protease [Trypanosoma cruzi]